MVYGDLYNYEHLIKPDNIDNNEINTDNNESQIDEDQNIKNAFYDPSPPLSLSPSSSPFSSSSSPSSQEHEPIVVQIPQGHVWVEGDNTFLAEIVEILVLFQWEWFEGLLKEYCGLQIE